MQDMAGGALPSFPEKRDRKVSFFDEQMASLNSLNLKKTISYDNVFQQTLQDAIIESSNGTQADTLNPSKQIDILFSEANNQGQMRSSDLHPAVQSLGIKLLSDQFQTTNQVTVAILLALKDVIWDFV